MSTTKKKAKKSSPNKTSRSKSTEPTSVATLTGAARTASVNGSVVSANGKPRRRLSASERKTYFENLSKPRNPINKNDNAQKVVGENGQITWTRLTPEQIAANERKSLRDKKIEQMWLQGIRPEIKDKSKPDFQLNFKSNELTYDIDEEIKQKKVAAENAALKKMKGKKEKGENDIGLVGEEEERRKNEEKAWLEGLRPGTDGKGNKMPDWNLDTDIKREPSPEPLFNDDDEY